MATNSLKSRVVQSHYTDIVNSLQQAVETVARSAYSKNLITLQTLEVVENTAQSSSDRASSKLLQQIQKKITENEVHFDSFVDILKGVGVLNDLAEKLSSALLAAEEESCQLRKEVTTAVERCSKELESSVSGILSGQLIIIITIKINVSALWWRAFACEWCMLIFVAQVSNSVYFLLLSSHSKSQLEVESRPVTSHNTLAYIRTQISLLRDGHF